MICLIEASKAFGRFNNLHFLGDDMVEWCLAPSSLKLRPEYRTHKMSGAGTIQFHQSVLELSVNHWSWQVVLLDWYLIEANESLWRLNNLYFLGDEMVEYMVYHLSCEATANKMSGARTLLFVTANFSCASIRILELTLCHNKHNNFSGIYRKIW